MERTLLPQVGWATWGQRPMRVEDPVRPSFWDPIEEIWLPIEDFRRYYLDFLQNPWNAPLRDVLESHLVLWTPNVVQPYTMMTTNRYQQLQEFAGLFAVLQQRRLRATNMFKRLKNRPNYYC